MQVTVDHRGAEVFGQCHTRLHRTGHDDATSGNDNREFGAPKQLCRLIETVFAAGAELELTRLRDIHVDLTVEKVPRYVELRRPALGHGHVEATGGELGDAARSIHVPLVLGNLGENRQLLGFLEASKADSGGARFRCDRDHWGMCPVGGGDGSNEIGDTGTVLRDTNSVLAADTRIAIGHMACALLMYGRNKSDPGGRKDIQRIHVS